MSLKIATWNVNSIRARRELASRWLKRSNVDILSMQEIKTENELFPFKTFRELGYTCEAHGQKAYNGVSICSRLPFKKVIKGWPDGEDDERRIIVGDFGKVKIVNVYVPRGGKEGSERHAFKIYFLTKLKFFLDENFSKDDLLCVVGDMNVARSDIDVYDPVIMKGRIAFMEDERQALEDLLSWGLYDLFREKHPDRKQFTWWDIETAAFSRNQGLRIDYILVTKPLLERCMAVDVDVEVRKPDDYVPSDHAPVWAEFDIDRD